MKKKLLERIARRLRTLADVLDPDGSCPGCVIRDGTIANLLAGNVQKIIYRVSADSKDWN